nr:right-handed parallel beta-helix repeat-containing protein [Exiguobacterium sp.]
MKQTTLAVFIAFSLLIGVHPGKADAATTKKTYRITPKTEAIDPAIRKYTTYNTKTRNH